MSPVTSTKQSKGRSKDPTKRAAILNAAGALFLENALGDISMDDVAKQAKVSKITVYNHFADKRDLLKTMIENKLNDNLSHSQYASLTGDDPLKELMSIATGFINIIYSKDGMNMYRTVMAESKRGEDIPHMFYYAALKPTHDLFKTYLTAMELHQDYSFPDKDLAADVFFSMFKGDRYMRQIAHISTDDQQDLATFAKQRVQLFLKLFKQPTQKVVLSDKKQAYLRDLEKMLAGYDLCCRTLLYLQDKAAHPALKTALQHGMEGMAEAMASIQTIFHRYRHKPRHSKANALAAMCKEAEEDVCVNYASDAVCDTIIVSHYSRICHYASASYYEYIAMANTMGLNEDVALFSKDLSSIKTRIAGMQELGRG